MNAKVLASMVVERDWEHSWLPVLTSDLPSVSKSGGLSTIHDQTHLIDIDYRDG